MLNKNIEKVKRKQGHTWSGLFSRKTPTKKECLNKITKKYRKKENYDKS